MLLPLAHMWKKEEEEALDGGSCLGGFCSCLEGYLSLLCVLTLAVPLAELAPALLPPDIWGCQWSLFNTWICLLLSDCMGLWSWLVMMLPVLESPLA